MKFDDVDDIVVGSGAGGAVVAARLSEDPSRKVLLLEAGPDYPSLDETPEDLKDPWISLTAHDWGLSATTGGRTIPYPRGKVVGGSTAVNAAVATRGTVEDFELWVGAGCDEWSFEHVLPFYMKLETVEGGDPSYHGTSGPIWITTPRSQEWQPISAAFAAALAATGTPVIDDHNQPGRTGVGPCSYNIRNGTRWSVNAAYLAPVRDRRNLEIRPHTVVDSVAIEKGRAVGVSTVVNGRRQEIRGSRVTLAAGAIGTPCILQRSGVGPEACITAIGRKVLVESPGVGANLMDHSGGAVAAYSRREFRARPDRLLRVFLSRRPQGHGTSHPVGSPAAGRVLRRPRVPAGH